MTRTMRHTLTMRGAGIAAAVAVVLGAAVPAQAWHVPHRHSSANWQPGDVEPPLGTEANPMHVYDQPSHNPGGGSQAWADYGLYQVLRATKPSPAAKATCQVDQPGESIWIDGGMMLPDQWVATSVTAFTRQPGDVDVLVNDSDGTHGGDCAPVGLVLRHVQ